MTERSRLQSYHPEEALRHLLDHIKQIIENPRIERNMLMTLSANVQKLVDEIRENSDLVKSLKAGSDLQTKQIADLQTTVASLQGNQASAEDVAAIAEQVSALAETNDSLKTAVPANTPADPAAASPDAQAPAEAPVTPTTETPPSA